MEFNFNARQYYDFNKRDLSDDELYFEAKLEDNEPNHSQNSKITSAEVTERKFSTLEDSDFISPTHARGIAPSTIYLNSRIRKSMSFDNVITPPSQQPSQGHTGRPRSVSKERINRLAQPKRCRSSENVAKHQLTLGEAISRYETTTPKRFHSKPPKLIFHAKAEEINKFRLRSNSLNRSITKGPLKASVHTSTPTNADLKKRAQTDNAAFHFATDQRIEARRKFEMHLKKREDVVAGLKQQRENFLKKKEEEEVAEIKRQAEFKAQPIRKYKDFKIRPSHKITQAVSPIFHTDKRQKNQENGTK